MRHKTEILFFVPELPALDNPILHAQVLSVAAFLNQKGFSCKFAGAETSSSRAREAVDLIAKEYAVPAWVVPALTADAGAYQWWLSCLRVYRHMRSELRGSAITHVYARSFIGSMWARMLARKSGALSIFDVRGVLGWEQQLKQKSSMKARVCSYLELRESRLADRLSTVSEKLRLYLREETGRPDITVIPSCFNEESFHFDAVAREEIRKSLKLAHNDILLCYSGGISAWQRLDDIIELLRGVCERNTRCQALFLSSNQGEVTQRLGELQFPQGRAFVRGCSHKEVHRFLSAADVGIIMRYDIPVNNVASPVKVAEYLACGLPVVLTRGIGDYSDWLQRSGVGFLLDETADAVHQVNSFIAQCDFRSQREAAMRLAKTRLTMPANLDQYQLLYAGR